MEIIAIWFALGILFQANLVQRNSSNIPCSFIVEVYRINKYSMLAAW